MGQLNLIRDPWIPIRHRSGRTALHAPWEALGEADDPALAVASPRADLDGGIMQLLIGLIQTAMPPENEEQWLDRAERKPTQAELRERLEPLADAFELLGPGPRFQQDVRVAGAASDQPQIEKLLIDLGPSEGNDHFARNGSVGPLCLPCAAAALATLQASAPRGGRGHRTSLRGGGPLTTLVIPADTETSLWTTVWLNVLPLSALQSADSVASPLNPFPWMASPIPDKLARSNQMTPDDASFFQVFFSMPRRIWLGRVEDGVCGLCGQSDTPCLSDYETRPHGIHYIGGWIHPLSPYRRSKEEQWIALTGPAQGLGYRHWLGLVIALQGGDRRCALPVAELLRSGSRFEVAGDLRLWAFGYAMKDMAAEAWSEGVMPVYAVPTEVAPAYADDIRKLVEGAEMVEGYVRTAFKKLVARRLKDVKRDPVQISARFWERTESLFYQTARAVLQALREGHSSQHHREEWHGILAREAMTLFDQEVGEADFRAADPAQVARSWNELRRAIYGRKLKQVLDLPIEGLKPKRRRRR